MSLDKYDYVVAPFTVAVDTREQAPYRFRTIKGNAAQKYQPVLVPQIEKTLRTGDYSIVGFEDQIAIERKSKEDAFSTFCHGHDRFERELARLSELPGWSGVIIEASIASILTNPPENTKYTTTSFFGQLYAWQLRFRNVHWWFEPTRGAAEKTVYEWLRRFYLDHEKAQKQKEQPGVG